VIDNRQEGPAGPMRRNFTVQSGSRRPTASPVAGDSQRPQHMRLGTSWSIGKGTSSRSRRLTKDLRNST
jgi:hypothetical protein